MEATKSSRRFSRNKVEISTDLLIVKDLIGKPRKALKDEEEFKNKLHSLGHRMDEIEKMVRDTKNNLDPKRKKEIIFLVENKEMTAEDIGKFLKMSRNRANEYLKGMEREGILSSRFFGKKKYYRILKMTLK
jgi:predicted transcriptional regulator